MRLTLMAPETVERVAHIIGPFSGAAQALTAHQARLAAGEPSAIYFSDKSTWIVGPPLEEDVLDGLTVKAVEDTSSA